MLDRTGVVRYTLSGSYMGAQGPRQLPSIEEIVRELEQCDPGTPGRG